MDRVTADELRCPPGGRERPGDSRLPGQEPPQVVGQGGGRRIPPPRVLLQTLQTDGFKVPRKARLQSPVPPRRLQPSLSRDLEAVCLKCLEKDSRRRYPSAASLADDLRRFLAGQPTVARPLSAAGRTAKFVRRYPIHAALAAVTLLSLAAGL